MRHRTKKQKIRFILAAAGLALLALLLLFLLLREPSLRGEKTPEPTSTPYASSTAAPQSEQTTVAGKSVDPATDSFDLSGRALSETDMEEIASLRSLTTLSLTNCGVSDLHFLSGLRSLRTLYLPDNRINDLTALSGLTELKTLYLDRNPLTDLSPLAALPNLRTLSLQGVTIPDYVLEDLRAAMPECRIFSDSVVESARPISIGGLAFTEDVETLDLSARGITDITKLSYCLQLRELNLSNNPLGSLSTLSGLPKLTELNLSNTGLTDDSLDFLQTLRKLTYLDLRGNGALTAEALDVLKTAMPGCQVEHDTVYYTIHIGPAVITSDVTEADLAGLGLTGITGMEKCLQLRRLNLLGNALTELGSLRELYGLEELVVSYNNLQDITALSSHAALRTLRLDHNALRDIQPLSGCTGLEELDLSFNQLDYLAYLNGCTALRQLNITGNPALTAEQIRALQQALPGCVIITDVDLTEPPAEEPAAIPEPAAAPEPVITPEPAPEPIPVFPDPIPIGAPEG